MNMNEVHNKLTFKIVSAPNKRYNIFLFDVLFLRYRHMVFMLCFDFIVAVCSLKPPERITA